LAKTVASPLPWAKYQQLKRENEELKRIIGMIVLDLEEEKKERYLKFANNKTLLSFFLGYPEKEPPTIKDKKIKIYLIKRKLRIFT